MQNVLIETKKLNKKAHTFSIHRKDMFTTMYIYIFNTNH